MSVTANIKVVLTGKMPGSRRPTASPPWTATDSLLAALPNASRTVLSDAGHAPWAERPADTRSLLIDALRHAPS